jgi:hypothetical protein
MAKIKVSSIELVWIFNETLKSFDDCSPTMSIAIVPSPDVGWKALMSAKYRTRYPHGARRVEAVQEQLREVYVLRD